MVAFEVDLCVASGFTIITPILAKAAEPIPTLLFLFYGLISILMAMKIGPKKKVKEENLLDKIEQTVLSLI
jgi:hypothetical protein